jgi:hypothetical protein
MAEPVVLASDYPTASFKSDMTMVGVPSCTHGSTHASQPQNQALNNLLNEAARTAEFSPCPIHFFRARHIDSFYDAPGPGKVRVSRDREGRVVDNGCIRKRRLGDLNVTCPGEALDFRMSVSTEDPCQWPLVFLAVSLIGQVKCRRDSR